MAVPYYPGALYTPKLGLGLFGQDEVLADNFVILDAAFGSGSSINVNGTLVESPNLNNTLPTAPAGKTNVIWQVDINGNVSAYTSTAATTNPGGSNLQLQYNNSSAFGGTSGVTFSDPAAIVPSKLLIVADASTSAGNFYNPIEIHSSFALGYEAYTHSDTAFRAPTVAHVPIRGDICCPNACANSRRTWIL